MECFLREFCAKIGLNKRIVIKLENHKVITCSDFVNLTDRDLRNLNLTIGQAAVVKIGIQKLKSVSMAMANKIPHNNLKREADNLIQPPTMPGGAMTAATTATTTTTTDDSNIIVSKAMSFVREIFHLLLRYVAMLVLLAYHTGEKILQALASPFQPVTAEAKKVPKSEVTVQGIFRTFLRFMLLTGLYCWSAVSGLVKYLFRPVESIVESAKGILNEEPPNIWEKAK